MMQPSPSHEPTRRTPRGTPAIPETPLARTAPRELRAVEDALRAASRRGDYFDAALADAVLLLGRAARRACLSPDDLVAALRATVFGTLTPSRPTAVADAVNVFLWRYARRGYHGDAPVRRLVDVEAAERPDDGVVTDP